VIIPFSQELTIPEYVFKKYRTNKHYIILIKAIAFWNQKQRETKQDRHGNNYIEATLSDVAWANHLSKEILLQKSDELNTGLRSFFEGLKSYLKQQKKAQFFTREIQNHFRLYPMKVNRYLREELEPRGLIKRIGGNFKTSFEYAVVVWNDYEKLQQGVDVMDEILKKLKKKYRQENSKKVLA